MTLIKALHDTGIRAVETLGPTGLVALALFLLLYVGVVLPTVWSRHAYRRTAARRTLTTLLDHLARLGRVVRGLLPW
ncbi:hypothetical protein ACIGZJ_12410 [Kitasatospora sp. NPDC052868]|uniref:hypothetical protein n=1 Tax=Kitasatospora sp. NPDC052868 TaxID=3364060 RepID=UPI0037C95F08